MSANPMPPVLRRPARPLLALLALALASLACVVQTAASPPPPPTLRLATAASSPTAAPTVTPLPSITSAAGAAETASATSSGETATPAAPDPTAPAAPTTRPPTSPPSPSATWAGVSRVSITLIAIDDQGKTGTLVGCGDSAVAVTRQLPQPTRAPLRAALLELLSLRDQYYGQSGLYNALYQSQLALDSVTIDAEGTALIALTGTLTLGGVCDGPRVEAQLELTARQFSTVKSVVITINGEPLDEVLSLQG